MMPKYNHFEVEEPDASIEISLYGNTLAWCFFFDVDKETQAGIAAISEPDHAVLASALLAGAVQLLNDADWQNILPFDDRADRWQVAQKRKPSEEGDPLTGVVIPPDDLPF